MTIKVGIIGASGFTGGELIRILEKHPEVELTDILSSRSYEGQSIQSLFPELETEAVFTNYSIEEIIQKKPDIIFLALPAGVAMKMAPVLLAGGIKVIDLSGDYRFTHYQDFESAYGIEHLDRNHEAVFGLCEINREQIQKAQLIANPGCYVTAALLALYPLRLYIDQVIIDGKSGWSGAGREADPEKFKDTFTPYKLTGHRHEAEIKTQLGVPQTYFSPGVLPFYRGIVDTIHIFLKEDIDVQAKLQSVYKDSSFIKIFDEIPDLRNVQNTNECHIGGVTQKDGRVVIVSMIDNLLKGASGQAVQNMNIIFQAEETMGLV